MKKVSPTALFDTRMMQRAIALAKRGEGRVEPNPMVGCVIANRGRVLAEGYHRRFGGAHAEVVALRKCGSAARGATVYVTLEPCCHHGKTPPCADALIAAGVARVVVATKDPNPQVAGRGIRALTKAGVKVDLGVERAAALELIAPFATTQTLRRPYLIAKWAQGLDGSLVTPPGESPWISCETSLKFVHRLRARVDAIMVGSGTVKEDDPLLTARDVPLRRLATRVILDTCLRITTASAVVQSAADIPTIVFTARQSSARSKARALACFGVEVIGVPRRTRGVCVRAVLREMHRRGMTNVLVEGGPMLLDALFAKQLVDEAHVFIAPRFVGGGSMKDRSQVAVTASAKPTSVKVTRSGDDMRYHLRFNSPA